MNVLVGYTGFVGSNLFASGAFERGYNSKNIQEAYGLRPDILVYAGLRAEKYLANNFPEKDFALIKEAEHNLEKICPRRLVLISTIDVYKDPIHVTEDTEIVTEGLQAYGFNRYLLEQWVREHYPDALIIRLPGLFGKNLKKNFIYDFIHQIPFMLKEKKFLEFFTAFPELAEYYEKLDNGFRRCRKIDIEEENVLKEIFSQLNFSALNFTDSRSIFQFYPLDRLWKDINIALSFDLKLWNPATEPVSAAELYRYLSGEEFVNEISNKPALYDYWTKYAGYFEGKDGYIMSKTQVLDEIGKFVKSEMGRKKEG